MATPTLACARAGASFVPSPIIATNLPACCSFLIYSILSSGLASAIKSSTPAFSAIYFAVNGLSPVTMTVFTPILRRRSKRSWIPGLIISCNSMTPVTFLFTHTTNGVPPLLEIEEMTSSTSFGNSFPAPSTILRIASKAPLRICVPSARSTPEHLVSAVNLIIRAPVVFRLRIRMPDSRPSSTIDLPSGVSSDKEDNRQVSTKSCKLTPGAVWKWVALRLPMVIVPVLSSNNVSISPAVSTALPDLVITLARSARSIPAIPIAERSPPIVVGIRHTNKEISEAMVMTVWL